VLRDQRPGGHRDLVTVVVMPPRSAPANGWTVSGTWVNSREARPAVQGLFLSGLRPDHRRRDREVLGFWEMILGNSASIYASKLGGAAFGRQVFEVIEQAPERLREVPGIGPVRGQRISQAWADQKLVREIRFPCTAMCRTARAVRIFKTMGTTPCRYGENPYRLAPPTSRHSASAPL